MATSSSEVTSPSPFMSYLAYLPSLVRDWLLGRGWLALVALENGRPCCRHQRGTCQLLAVEPGCMCWACRCCRNLGTGHQGPACQAHPHCRHRTTEGPLQHQQGGSLQAAEKEVAQWLMLCKLRKGTGGH